jgi:RNA polymerase sigma factor (sigma-70 family)
VRRTKPPSLEALATVYRERYHHFVRVAEAITGDVDRARDAVQEAFAGAIRARSGFRGEGSLESWLWSCVVNAARKARGPLEEELREAGPGRSNGLPDESGAVRAVVAALPERQRLVLFLRYYADLDYGSIAEALGVATGTVGAALNAAHAKLRRSLEEVRND